MSTLPELFLNPHAERRLRAGHLWIYSNEIDTARSPLKQFEAGQQVQVLAANGKPLGIAYINPHTLICARLVSRDHPLDKSLLVHRLNIALALVGRTMGPKLVSMVAAELGLESETKDVLTIRY